MKIPYSLNTLKSITQNFFEEILAAERGKKNSLAFIKTKIPKSLILIKEKIYQKMTVGGTFFEAKTIENNKITKEEKQTLGFYLSTKKNFFSLIENYLNPKTNLLILNFAFPLKPILRGNILDGKLIKGTKEHRLSDLIGRVVGEELENYIFQKQKRKIKVTVANDTIFLLLSGLKKGINPLFLVAGIIGTGTNFGFFLDEKTAINLESGNFDKFPQSETGKIIDEKSENPGEQRFEKEVAGAYLFAHYNLLNNLCHSRDLSREVRRTKRESGNLIRSTKQLSLLAQKGDILAQKVLTHSASLIACQVAGIKLYKQLKIKNLKLKIIKSGSLFLRGWKYKEMVENYMKKILKLF